MKTIAKKTLVKGLLNVIKRPKNSCNVVVSVLLVLLLIGSMGSPVFAHCDSYDGPVIKDAIKALETNNVNMVLKWVDETQEPEITYLFNKTCGLRNGDKEIYALVEKHFFETLVRLHRQTEGAPYDGLKAAGTTKPIILLSDKAIASGSVEDLLSKLNGHIGQVVREKYHRVEELAKVKETSVEKGREYVKAYVDYTHTLEALHDILDAGYGEQVHRH